MNQLSRTFMGAAELVNYFTDLNSNQYAIYCVATSKSLAYWAKGPFRMGFRFIGDSTVYLLAQKDLFPEFDALDFLKWANFSNMGMGFFAIEWELLINSLVDRPMLTAEVILIPGNTSHESWEFFKYYWENYFPYFPIAPDWE
ncbi:E4.1 [Bovine atadenovirus D]|uniref:E4.1 n=1 Tax=Bovine adenovirus 4 TaxID=70333 RepID=Q997G9_ADEB4|nr:E4.1 [Bovine atadenovirus D]AAK13173.1 E4.1 [Bovine adenovirus 4]